MLVVNILYVALEVLLLSEPEGGGGGLTVFHSLQLQRHMKYWPVSKHYSDMSHNREKYSARGN